MEYTDITNALQNQLTEGKELKYKYYYCEAGTLFRETISTGNKLPIKGYKRNGYQCFNIRLKEGSTTISKIKLDNILNTLKK